MQHQVANAAKHLSNSRIALANDAKHLSNSQVALDGRDAKLLVQAIPEL